MRWEVSGDMTWRLWDFELISESEPATLSLSSTLATAKKARAGERVADTVRLALHAPTRVQKCVVCCFSRLPTFCICLLS